MSLLHVNCPGYDVYSLEEEGVLTKMKKMLMKGRKRSLVPACRLFSGFDDDDETEEDINIDEDWDEKP